ncbi:MAG TPA: hypothetical protein VIN40_04805 [Candidatus Tyrphobacter sp.]
MKVAAAPFLLVAAVATGIAAGAQHTALELAQITARGRALYAYDTAAAQATDAVQARFGRQTPPPTSGGSRMFYIGSPSFSGWVFDFGMLNTDKSAFSVSYRAVEAGPGVPTFDVTKIDARAETPFDVEAARAIVLAMGDFQFPQSQHSYNYAVLRRQDGEWYVYLYPGWSDVHDHPLGGDGRYTISADGMQILERHRMHNAIIEQPTTATGVPADAQVTAGFHTDVVEDVPQDSDVFHVLIRRPRMPDYVSAQGHMYKIDTDGSIEDLGVGVHPFPIATP